MKRPLLFVLILSLFACTEMTSDKKAVISGRITNPAGDFIAFNVGKASDTALLDSLGTFSLTIKLEKPSYATLHHGTEISQMFLYPGDDIFLTLDPEMFDETINYAGQGAIQNNYLAEKFLINEKMHKDPRESFKMDEEMFLKLMDKNQFVLLNHLDTAFSGREEEYATFIKLERNRLHYEKASEMLMYPSYHSYLTKNQEFQPGDDYYAFLDGIMIDDGEMLQLDEYRSLIRMYVSEMARQELKRDTTLQDKYESPYDMLVMTTILEDFKDEQVKNHLLKEFVMEFVNYRGLSREDTAMKIFYANCTDTALIRDVEKGIVKWERIARGQPAPGFEYPDIDGEMVALDDLRGKYVYIDVWATWCGPCKAEIPHLKALEVEMHDRNIVFVSVSVDDSKEDWENMVRDKELGGIQLFGGSGWKSSITEDYNIKGIPRFILIDKDGMIIDATAARPSGNIKEILLAQEGI